MDIQAEAEMILRYLLALRNNEHVAASDDGTGVAPATEEEIDEMRMKYKELTGQACPY